MFCWVSLILCMCVCFYLCAHVGVSAGSCLVAWECVYEYIMNSAHMLLHVLLLPMDIFSLIDNSPQESLTELLSRNLENIWFITPKQDFYILDFSSASVACMRALFQLPPLPSSFYSTVSVLFDLLSCNQMCSSFFEGSIKFKCVHVCLLGDCGALWSSQSDSDCCCFMH